MNNIPLEKIKNDLIAIGVKNGDLLYVHSSMKKVGMIDGSMNDVVKVFLNVLGDNGTLAAPVHTYSYVGRDVPPFNRIESKSTCGIFSETVRNYPGAKRSGHASHSTSAVGRLAEFITENHDPESALGYCSPLHRLYRSGGKILLLGVSQSSNTIIHLAEFLSDVPYVYKSYCEEWGDSTQEELADGAVVKYKQKKYPGCSSKFRKLNEFLTDDNKFKKGEIGNSESYLMDSKYAVDKAIELLMKSPDYFLCDHDKCPCCGPRRELLKKMGLMV